MDSSFTEHILQRARERQKKLQQLNPTKQRTPPRGPKTIDIQTEPLSPNSGRYQEKASACNIENTTADSPKDVSSEGRVQKIIRHSSSTKISSNLPGSPKPQLKTLNIQKENFNMEIKLISSDNIRVEVEIQESDSSDKEDGPPENQESTGPGLREHAKHKLKKLGRLYAGGEDADISSPIYRTEENFLMENNVSKPESNKKTNYLKPNSKRGLSKLVDLAQDIKEWEDDTNNVKTNKVEHKTPTRKWKAQAPQPPISNNIQETIHNSPTNKKFSNQREEKIITTRKVVSPQKKEIKSVNANSNSEKTLELDQGVLKTLESQGFTRTTSNSRLVYNYNNKIETERNNENKVPKSRKEQDIKEENEEETIKESQKSVIVTKKFSPLELKKEENKVTPRSPKKNIQTAIASKTAMFESSPSKLNNDPALMSLAERKALFEKNKGAALIPKAAFAMPIPISNKENKGNADPVSTPKTTKWNVKQTPKKDEVNEKLTNLHANNQILKNKEVNQINEPSGIASKIAALINNKNTISQEQISNNIKEQRQKDMDVLFNRFNRNKEISQGVTNLDNKNNSTEYKPSEAENKTPLKVTNSVESTKPDTPDRRSGEKRTKKNDSPQVSAVLEDVKRVRVSEPKEGRLYPSLSDIETANETEAENAKSSCDNSGEESFCSSDGDINTSFGRDILQAVCKAQTPQKRPIIEEESTGSEVSDILDDMDDYLDEAMANENYDCSNGPTPPKLGKASPQENEGKISRPSNSFHYKSFSPNMNKNVSPLKTPAKKVATPRKSSDLPAYVVDGDNVLPLTHTVSFYRRQQTPVTTPIRQISRQPLIDEEAEDINPNPEYESVEKKIQELLEEVNKQQMVISQTSQALNLCNSTLEFMGSTEQVEAEKLLLLATHRRQACLHEVQRLKVEGTLRPQDQHAKNIPLEKGSLVISNIVLPMKKEYVRALAAAGGKGHHVVCLIKCGEQVVSTQLTSTVASSSKNPDRDLYIPGNVKLNSIYSDFTLTFEVYCLQAQEEILPHEVKYHINKKGNNKSTPKKAKQESRMVLPPKESPAGPQAVRSSSFALMGYVIFSVQSINKTHWTLNKAPSMSPLEGRVDMQISCDLNVSIEHKGFLTVFEDISGFGAWHRRWYMLKGHVLCYWKYPDDEKKKPPTDSINLKQAITREAGPVSRDICARLHTFLIETERDVLPDDKESLTLIRKGDKTIVRHLLSADTKEERIEWCQMFNKALIALKMWGKNT